MTDPYPSTPLDQLAAFAREHAEQLRDAVEAAEAERREHEAREAVLGAVNEFIHRFTVDGIQPPVLTWTGYASGKSENEPPYRIQATAHLGEGIFLAYRQGQPGENYGTYVPFTLVAVDHPDNLGQPAPARIRNILDLAEAINRIETARHAARVAELRSEIQ